jgi:cell division protein FtsB
VNKRCRISLGLVLFAMIALLLVVIFGDKGWLELRQLQNTRMALVRGNALLTKENSQMFAIVDRLQNDSTYIENIARQELGMIRPDEVIFKFSHKAKTAKR